MFGWVGQSAQIQQAVALSMQVFVGARLCVQNGKAEWEAG